MNTTLNKLKSLFTQTEEAVTMEQFNQTQLMLSLEANYNSLSNFRFNNVNDRQRKLKVMTQSLSGMNRILKILGRFEHARKSV